MASGITYFKLFAHRAPHLFVLSILLALDAWTLYYFLLPTAFPPFAIAAHCIVAWLCSRYALILVPGGHRTGRALIALSTFILCTLLPVIGVFFSIGVALQIHRAALVGSRLDNYLTLEDMTEIGDDDFYTYGDEINSIADIMHSNDIVARRRTTLALRSIEPIFAIPVLRKLIQDSDETVRLYALNVLRDITNHFEGKSRRLNHLREQGQASVTDLIELAEYYREQVYVGLAIDEAQRHSMLSKAISSLEEAHARDPENLDLLFTIVKYALANNDTERAGACMAELDQHIDYKGNLFPWRCELYYADHNWPGLRNMLRKIPESQRTNKRLMGLRSFWLNEENTASS